jgi:tetratricopeptide (TPR) repeat protein
VGPSLFLAAFHFDNTEWCERFVNESEALLVNSNDEFLKAFVTERRGKISPNLLQSDIGLEVLSNFVQNPPDIRGDPLNADPAKRQPHNLANSMHGCVYIMLAHQLYTLDRSDEALEVILKWHSLEPSSISERATERYRDRTLADIYVGLKEWSKAKEVLESILSLDMRDAESFKGTMGEGWAIHQLAGIYLEMRRYNDANSLVTPAILAREKEGNEDREDNILLMLDLVCSNI